MSGQICDYKNRKIKGVLSEDTALFRDIFKKDAVLRVKDIKVEGETPLDCALIYMDGMVDSDQLNEAVIKPIITVSNSALKKDVASYLQTQVLFARDVKKTCDIEKILAGILYGEALLLIDGSREALMIDAKGWRTRGVEEPSDERVLKGPREGFNEAALLNLALIRRRLQTPDLCFEMLKVGRRSSTTVFVCYLDSLASKKTLKILKERISKIDIDGVLDSNYLAEETVDNKRSLFKTVGSTERPDVVAARLLEGRIAVVVDGTPMVLTLPYLFSENFQSDEDYYVNYLSATAGRILRYIAFILSVSLPALFICLTSFQKELLPTSLAIAVDKLRGGVPFSVFSECLILIFVFEVLKETGSRAPQSLGHALSIVGGLVVGQVAVESRIISTPMLIIIALSGISGLMVPRLRAAELYIKLLLIFLSAVLGLMGFILGTLAVAVKIFSLTSFGTDYTGGLKAAGFNTLKDTFLRAGWSKMKTRPFFNKNIIRQVNKK